MSHSLGVKCPTCGTQTVPEGCPEGCPLGHGSTFTVCPDCSAEETP